jgi:hypothetical protein
VATFEKYHRDVKETQIAASEDLSKPEPGSLAEIYQLEQPAAEPTP